MLMKLKSRPTSSLNTHNTVNTDATFENNINSSFRPIDLI